MKHIKIIFLCFLFALILKKTNAQNDSLTKISDFEKEKLAFFKTFWQNPTMKFAFPIKKIAELAFIGSIAEKKAAPAQEAKQQQTFVFQAHSFSKKKNYLYYGAAKYKKSLNKNSLWNTSADYQRLIPYIIADTIPATVNNETYAFEGGYALKIKKINLGAFASYRAVKEFRELDPRPLNNVADLNVSIANSLLLKNNYLLSINWIYNQYQQNQDIGIFKQGSAAKIFFLRGFGISEQSFSSVVKDGGGLSNIYKQKIHKINLSLLPLSDKGFFANIGISNKKFSLLGDYNDLVSSLIKNKFATEIGRKISLSKHKIALKLEGNYIYSKGNEYNYSFNRKLLNKINKYHDEFSNIAFSLLDEYHYKSNIYTKIKVDIEYKNQKTNYYNLGKTVGEESFSSLHFSGTKSILFLFQKSLFLSKIYFGYQQSLHKYIKHPPLEIPLAKISLVEHNYKLYTANFAYADLLLRYDYKVREHIFIFAKLLVSHTLFFELNHNQKYLLSLGFNF